MGSVHCHCKVNSTNFFYDSILQCNLLLYNYYFFLKPLYNYDYYGHTDKITTTAFLHFLKYWNYVPESNGATYRHK